MSRRHLDCGASKLCALWSACRLFAWSCERQKGRVKRAAPLIWLCFWRQWSLGCSPYELCWLCTAFNLGPGLVQKQEGVPPKDQRLSYRGESLLEGGRMLADCIELNEHTLHVV